MSDTKLTTDQKIEIARLTADICITAYPEGHPQAYTFLPVPEGLTDEDTIRFRQEQKMRAMKETYQQVFSVLTSLVTED